MKPSNLIVFLFRKIGKRCCEQKRLNSTTIGRLHNLKHLMEAQPVYPKSIASTRNSLSEDLENVLAFILIFQHYLRYITITVKIE